MFQCNYYAKESEQVNDKYCNGWMHAVLNKILTMMCLAPKNKKNTPLFVDKVCYREL